VSTLGGKIYDYIFFPFPWTSYHSYLTWHHLYPPLRHQLRIRACNFPLHNLFTSILPGLILEIHTLEKWGAVWEYRWKMRERHKPLSHYTLPTSRPHTTMEASYTMLMGRGSRVGINNLSGEACASIMLYTPYTQTTSVMEACYTISMGKGSRVGMDDLKAIHLHDSSVLMVVHH